VGIWHKVLGEAMNKRLNHITELIEAYGLDRILEDNQITLPEALDILDELGFVCLEQYGDCDVDSSIYD
jgi:hypothetical protein